MRNDIQIVKKMIRESVHRYLAEQAERERVRELVKEELNKELIKRFIREDNSDTKRATVMDMLQNDKYDHAQLAYHLWNPKDESEESTYRSLFSKKAKGTRKFTDKEITSLYDFMRAE